MVLALTELLAGPVLAQVPLAWAPRGVGGGGSFFAPAISPFNDNEYFVTSDMSEVFRTTNYGASYQVIPFGQIQGNRYSLVQFTSNSNLLYSLSYYDGNNAVPVKSTNGGANWSKLPGNPLPWDESFSVWAAFDRPQVVVLAGWSALYLSTNGGNTFSQISVPMPYGTGCLVGGAFFDGNNIYLGTSEGLVVSTNGGASFVNAGYPGIPAGEYVRSFAGAKVGGQMRFFALTVHDTYAGQDVGADYWGNLRGIYALDNATGPWVRRAGGIDLNTDFLMFIAMATNDLNTVYAGGSKYGSAMGDVPGIIKTTDGGVNWTNVFLAANNANITTGWSGQGGDRNWGYGEVVFGLVVAPGNSAKVVITDMGFVHNSTNGGATWRQAYTSPADEHPPGTTSIAKKTYHSIGAEDTSVWQLLWSDPTNIFAAFTDISGIRSTDGGNGWSFNYTGHAANTMYRVVKQPGSGVLYAATSDIHDLYQSTRLADYPLDSGDSNGKVLFSTDKGATWQLLHFFGHPVFWLCLDPNDPNTLYASLAHSTSGGVFVSTNIQAGVNSVWTKLPNPPRTEGHPACLQVLNDGQVVCTYSGHRTASGFSASSGVFVFDPTQRTWRDVSAPGMFYWTKDLVLDPADPAQNTWYVAVFSGWGGPPNGLGGLYRTTDRGAHWAKINALDRVTSITFNPANANEAYLTTETSGLWNTANIRAATPAFNLVGNYPFRQPERVFFNPYDVGEIWVGSFGNGLMVGRSGALTQRVEFAASTFAASETAGSVAVSLVRTGGTNGAVSVRFATVDGSAKAPANYTATNGVLTWPDGDATPRTLNVGINNAAGYSGNLGFGLVLSNATGAAIGLCNATICIRDTDPPPPRTNFNLVVVNGSGSGTYLVGSTVPVTAAAPPGPGYGFDYWVGTTVSNRYATNTTLTMPAADVTLTAVYKWILAGTNYHVGPGQMFTNLASVPWTNLMPNDVVNIHYRPGGYHEIILLSNSGQTNAPITLRGIPDPVTGALPTLDGSNAVASASIPWRATIFDYLGVVVVSRYMGTAWGYIPSWITIENLHIQNANRDVPMTDSAGVPGKFIGFACGIYVEFAQHLTIRNCEINGAENGFFCNSKDGTPLELSGDILIEHCHIHDNGYPGDYGVHNLYTEAMGITLQYNLIGPLRPGASGEQWKNRSAGTRIRYNQWIMGPGPGTCMWLESPQGGQGVIDLDPSYKTNWCYGNVIYNPPNSGGILMVRFDALGIEGVPRSGTLFFYNNTVVNHANQSQRYGTYVFELPHHDEVLSTGIQDRLDCRNNIIANLPSTPGAKPSDMSLLISDDGHIDYGNNWVSPGTSWFTLPWLKTNFYGVFTGTNQILFGDALGRNDPGFVDLPNTNFLLLASSRCLDAAGPQSPFIAGTADDIALEYVFPTRFQTRTATGAGLDLGAFEGNSTNLPPPPSAGALQWSVGTLSVPETAGSVTLTINRAGGTNGAVGVSFATADGTAIAPAHYVATNGTFNWPAGDATPRSLTLPIHNTPGYSGNRAFTLALLNPTGGATLGSPSVATATLLEADAAPPSYPPVADSQSVDVLQNVLTPITLTGHDGDNDPLTFTVLVPPARGTLSGALPNVSFLPSTNITGQDSFTFTVSDGKTNSAAGVVILSINAPTNPPPSVALLTPTNHSMFIAPTNLLLTATAAAASGVERVDYYNGTNVLVSVTNAPYSWTWTNPAPGRYVLFAKARSLSGARSFSQPVTIAVLGAQPRLSIQATKPAPTLSWPLGLDGWLLEQATNLPGPWRLSSQPVVNTPSERQTTVPVSAQNFFRLILPW